MKKQWHEIVGFFSAFDRLDYEHLVNQLPNHSNILEVGSFRGQSIASIADTIIRKNITVYAVDLFDKVVSENYHEPEVESRRAGMYDDFMKNMKDMGLSSHVMAFPMKSVDAAKHFSDRNVKFDLVFLDAGHSYEEVRDDINAWWPLVKDGGVLSGHDYDHNARSWPGVHKAVHEKFGQPYFGVFVWAVKKEGNSFSINKF